MSAPLRSVPRKYTMCRSFQHAWDYADVLRDGRALIQTLRCIRCATERLVRIDSRSGDWISTRYRYPEGYQVHGGPMQPAERAAIRLSEVKSNLRTTRSKAS